MKKVFGVQAEFNITADEDIVKGMGKGISNGSIIVADIIKEVKPEIVKGVKKLFEEESSSSKKTNDSESEKVN